MGANFKAGALRGSNLDDCRWGRRYPYAKSGVKQKLPNEGGERTRYGRMVGLVYIEGDGVCLNEELVRAGFA